MNKKIQTLGARNFVCNICNLKFLRRTDLTRHNKTKKHIGTVYSLNEPARTHNNVSAKNFKFVFPV